jgi:uncharacterized protein YjbI with pentapeptide repeats/uncharacterized protein YjdB
MVVVGCAGGDPAGPPEPTAITVAINEASVVVGASTRVQATVMANTQSIPGAPVSWSSSTPSVAVVSTDGTVTAVGRGTTRIIATLGGISGGTDLTVVGVRSITLTSSRPTIFVGEALALTAAVDADPGVSPAVAWSSSMPAVATVSANGIVTAVAAGTSVISASQLGSSGSVSIRVALVPVATVVVSPANATLLPGATQTLVAAIQDSTGAPLTGRAVTWASANPAVATVNSSGTVTAVAAGSVAISATAEGRSAMASVTVLPPVATVSVSPGSGNIPVGWILPFTAVARDAGGNVLTGRAVTWSSSAPSVASISAIGVATGVSPGTTVVSATVEGRVGTATVSAVSVAVRVSSDSLVTAVGDTVRLRAELRTSRDSLLPGIITWRGGDSTVARIDAGGLLTARSAGSMDVTATAGALTARIPVNVGANYRGQNLSGQHLTHRDLRFADFGNAQLVASRFNGSDLTGSRLRGANLTSGHLFGTMLQFADLTTTILSDARFDRNTRWPAGFLLAGRGMWGPGLDYSGMNLSGRTDLWSHDFLGANFSGANLLSFNLNGCNCEGTNFFNANLTSASLWGANFSGANFGGATLTEARFSRTTIWPSGFSSAGKGMWGPGLDYSDRHLAGRDFFNYDFAGASFRRANLSGANLMIVGLEGADLTDANLSNASLDRANLSGAIVTRAVFTGAFFNATTVWPAGFDPVAAGAIRR